MTSSPDTCSARRTASGAVVDVAVVQARLPPRAGADRRGILTGAAVGAAGCAARVLVQAARRGRAAGRLDARALRGAGARRFRDRDLVSPDRQHARAAPLPRQGDDRARVARGDAARIDSDDCAPGATRLSRSPLGAAQSGVHAGPHVHVAVFDVWVDPAARRDDRIARVDSSGAGAAGAVRAAAGGDVDVAPGRRTHGVRARRRERPSGAPPVRHGDDGSAWQGSARHRHRRSSRRGTAAGLGARLRPDRGGALGLGRLAHAGVGDLRRRICRRDRLCCIRHRGAAPATCC